MISLPPCPKCYGMMRATEFDGACCRCGFEIEHEAIARAMQRTGDDRRDALLARGRMVSPPDAKPGIHISEAFADLHAMCWDGRSASMADLVAATSDADNALFMRDEAIARGKARGLVFQNDDDARGRYLVVKMPDGTPRNLERKHLYALAPFGQQIEAARRMIDRLVDLRGPGRWWSLLDPVHLIADDSQIRIADVGGVTHVFLRALYCHLPTCPQCGEPCDEVEVQGLRLRGCPCVGSKDRAIAIDYSKIKKDPASSSFVYKTPYRVKYEPVTIDKAALDAAAKAPSFVDLVQRETDRALEAMYAERDAMLKNAYESQGLTIKKLTVTAAGRMAVIYDLAKRGEITQEQARLLLESPAVGPPAPDPLDVKYDGVTLRVLLERDKFNRCEHARMDPVGEATPFAITSAQRAAVSAHWSAELRARVETSKERDRQRVVLDQEID